MKRIKALFYFVKHDFVLIRGEIRKGISKIKLRLIEFKFRKLYKEPSRLFILLYSPFRAYRRIKDKIAARKMGVTLNEYLEIDTARTNQEIELISKDIQQEKLESLKLFSETFPRATLDQYTDFIERPRLITPRFIMSSIFRHK